MASLCYNAIGVIFNEAYIIVMQLVKFYKAQTKKYGADQSCLL